MQLRTAIVAAALCALTSSASADDPDPKRKIAVLEFRSGSAELANIGARTSTLLGKLTSLDVLDQNGARASYGDGLDSAVAQCAGEASCVGEIGRKLNVDELLLVGVAEFGDVILTLQRVDTANNAVLSRVAEALATGSSVYEDAIEGYLRRVLPKSDFLRYGVIRITSNIDGAAVSVDGKPRGKTPIEPLRVPAPATYSVRVTKPGYIDFRVSIAVPPGAAVQVNPELVRRQAGPVWYTKWWVLAIMGTVAAGAVTTAVIVGRSDPDDVGVSGNF